MKRLINARTTAAATALAAVAALIVPAAEQALVTVSASWSRIPAAGPSTRAAPSMAYDSVRHRSVLFGGSGGGVSYMSDTWQFDGTTWGQLQVAGPPARYLAPMVFDSARGVSVMFGGYNNGIQSDLWEWDGSTWTRKPTTHTPPLRLWTAMAYDSVRHATVLFGGAIDTGLYNDTWQYDGVDWTQVMTAHSPPARRGNGLAFDSARGRIVLFGGQNPAGVDLNDTWEFDGVDWSQVTTSTAPSGRLWHAMVYDPSLGGTVVFGGATDGYISQSDTWLYDGTSWQQPTASFNINPRWWAGAAFDSDRGSLFMFGGTSNSTFTPAFGDTWALAGITTSPVDWAKPSPSPAPPPRVFGAMDYDSARGVSVLFSGSSNGGPGDLQDTWEWNGSSWVQRFPQLSPPALAGAVMAYDTVRGVSVLFGGSGATGLSSSTWEWNGVNWTQRAPKSSPPARVWAAMAYDAARGRVVLFGGGNSNDTWLYDGDTWSQASSSPSPSARLGAAMAFDPVRSRTVLFGGRDASGQRLADTWVWDGSAWAQLATASTPYPRFWASLAFDAQRGETVLFGGDHIQPFAIGEENDTWEWDGSQWTRDWTSAAPPVRAGHSTAYDSARGRVVLFGGMNPATTPGTFYGDTWELGTGIQTPAGSPMGSLALGGQGADFGSVNVGATSPNAAAFLLNSTGTGPLTIGSITTTGDFAVSSSDCPSSANVLASGAYCVTLVTFTPTASGLRTGALTISDNAANGGLVVPLRGTGVLISTAIAVSPSVALFNTTATFTATLTANGSPLSGQAVTFKLPNGSSTTMQSDGRGVATWAGASLSGLHAGAYSTGIQVSFAGAPGFAPSSASAALTITQPVSTSYAGDFFVPDTSGAHIAISVDQRTPVSDKQFLDYSSTTVWARFVITGPTVASSFYAQVTNAADWTTSGLGVASTDAPALPDSGYTVVATLVTASGSTTPTAAVAGDEVRVGLVSSPTKGGYLSGGGAIAADPAANTPDPHGYFSFQIKPASTLEGNLVYVYRVNMDIGGGNLRDVDVWVTSTDVTSLANSGPSAGATGHVSVAYVDAQTARHYSALEFNGGTFTLSVVNSTNKAPAGFALVLLRPDGTLFHASSAVNPGGIASVVPVVLGRLLSNL